MVLNSTRGGILQGYAEVTLRIPVAGREEGSPAQIPLYLARKRVPWCRALEAEYDVPRVGVRKEARVLERTMLEGGAEEREEYHGLGQVDSTSTCS